MCLEDVISKTNRSFIRTYLVRDSEDLQRSFFYLGVVYYRKSYFLLLLLDLYCRPNLPCVLQHLKENKHPKFVKKQTQRLKINQIEETDNNSLEKINYYNCIGDRIKNRINFKHFAHKVIN